MLASSSGTLPYLLALIFLPSIPPCGPMTSIGPYKPFAMFAAISKVSLRQGEGILLYKYF